MRLFVALDMPWDLQDRLAGLATGIMGARWVPRENLHLTLRFIGEVPNWRAEEVDLALHAIRGRSFPLVLAGVGLFEKGGTGDGALGRRRAIGGRSSICRRRSRRRCSAQGWSRNAAGSFRM